MIGVVTVDWTVGHAVLEFTQGILNPRRMGHSSMNRIISCFTNCYGPAGVRAAVDRIREAGIDHLELALRGHNFGGLVIPESAVITEKADDVEAQEFCDHLNRHGVKISGCNVGGADIRTVEGVELTERRIRFAARWFGVAVCVSGAGQPSDSSERRTIVEHLRRLGRRLGRAWRDARPRDAQRTDSERRRRCSP